jgi:hypothetical protein
VPLDALSNNKAQPWVRFLRGTWLEAVVADLLCRAAPGRETARSVRALIDRSQARRLEFELDVAQVAGGRLYAVSCTTAHAAPGERSHTKLKMFEVSARARQLGGHLSRSAVVSLHPAEICTGLEREIAGVWEGDERPPRVFGIDDLREWHGGRLVSLSAWLKS